MADTSKNNSDRVQARQRGLLLSIAVLTVAILVVACAILLPDRADETPETQAPAVNVTVLDVAPVASLPDTVLLPAVVEPKRVVGVSAEVEGRIERILAKEGARVSAGQVLIEINTDFLKAALKQANAQAEYHRSEYKRIQDLTRRDVTAQRDLDFHLSQVLMSEAAMEEAKARLERAAIKAPAEGVLNRVPVEEGEYVSPGTPVAQIVNVDTVTVVVQTPEKDVPYFNVGGEALVESEKRGKATSTLGEIAYISKLADPTTRTTRVEIDVDNRDRTLLSGEIVRVRLTRQTLKDVLMIPLSAVIPEEKGHIVYVVEEGKAQPRPVVLGLFRGREVRVVDGLKPGDRLIVSGQRYVGPGQSVEVRQVGL